MRLTWIGIAAFALVVAAPAAEVDFAKAGMDRTRIERIKPRMQQFADANYVAGTVTLVFTDIEGSTEIVLGLGFEWAEGLVYPVEALAIVHVAADDHDLAVRAVGAAACARCELSFNDDEPQATLLRAALETAGAALGTQMYEELIAIGEATPRDEIARDLLGASTARTFTRPR